jgi:hypothetical protein
MKGIERNPIVVVLLTLVTCGIYGLYWMYVSRLEVKNYLENTTISPGVELLLAVVCFPFVYIWYYKMGQDVAKMQEKAGLPGKDQSMLFLVLSFFGLGLVANYIIQENLNEVWKQQ